MRFHILIFLFTAVAGFSAQGRQDPRGCIAELVNEFNEDYIVESLTRVEEFWRSEFERRGWAFHEIGYGLFTGSQETPCGLVKAEQGMIYCPAAHTVYLDPDYYHEHMKFSGSYFTWAFGYEFGQHVQAMLGVTARVMNDYDVVNGQAKLNYQAACFAGVYFRHLMTSGQIEQEQVTRLEKNLGSDKFNFIKGYSTRDPRVCSPLLVQR